MVISRYNPYPVSGKQSRYQTARRCCTFSGTSGRYFPSCVVPFLCQMFGDIKEIKVLGAYIFVVWAALSISD